MTQNFSRLSSWQPKISVKTVTTTLTSLRILSNYTTKRWILELNSKASTSGAASKCSKVSSIRSKIISLVRLLSPNTLVKILASLFPSRISHSKPVASTSMTYLSCSEAFSSSTSWSHRLEVRVAWWAKASSATDSLSSWTSKTSSSSPILTWTWSSSLEWGKRTNMWFGGRKMDSLLLWIATETSKHGPSSLVKCSTMRSSSETEVPKIWIRMRCTGQMMKTLPTLRIFTTSNSPLWVCSRVKWWLARIF